MKTLDRIFKIQSRLDRDLFNFDYSKVPAKYHAGPVSNTKLVLYKGAPKGYEKTGFFSRTLLKRRFKHLIRVKEIIESGDLNAIHKIIDRHTDYYFAMPFLSATFNPEEAQVFAPTDPLRLKIMAGRGEPQTTIYRLKVSANRCILDADDIGGAGASREILIFGLISPEEITAVKINNCHENSELREARDNPIIRYYPEKDSTNTQVKNPRNWLEFSPAQ